MKIPKCCKNCSNKNKGICNCVLPNYCDEWVEDDDTKVTGTSVSFLEDGTMIHTDYESKTGHYCVNCEALKKELKKVKQEKKKLSVKNGRYKRKIEKLLQTWLDSLCENKSFINEEKLKQELQKYDKDKLIELYLQMRFERDVWKDLEG